MNLLLLLSLSLCNLLLCSQNKPQSIRFHFFQCEEEKIQIIQAAATIIRNEIKNVNCRNDIYDIFDGLSDEKEAIAFIPVSLQIFLRSILVAKGSQDKIISLGQDIMQSAYPRKIVAPYQV